MAGGRQGLEFALGIDYIGPDNDETYLKEAVQRTGEVKSTRALPERGAARMRKAGLRASASSSARAAAEV